MSAPRGIAFVWDNFGPIHIDRCEAVARAVAPARVVGIELSATSDTYEWAPGPVEGFDKHTLAEGAGWPLRGFRLVKAILNSRARDIFFCHYERPEIFVAVAVTALLGRRCYTMIDSKFDDYPRWIWRELLKRLFMLPYRGAIVASPRTADYVRMLGIAPSRMAHGYNTADLSRLRTQAGRIPPPAFADRDFLVVARLVPKKNLGVVIAAYAAYRDAGGAPRRLVLLGSGPLEGELKAQAAGTRWGDDIVFPGFAQTAEVSVAMSRALCLLLVSTEEQFGLVIVEALAHGLPVIVSTPCGARDELVRSGVNGFLVEPENVAGIAAFMAMISRDEDLWTRLSEGSADLAAQGSAERFTESVIFLCGIR